MAVLKIVATRGEIFNLKFTKYVPFGGRALPGPAGGAKALPRPPSPNKGALLLRGREGKGREGGEGEKREGRGGEREVEGEGKWE